MICLILPVYIVGAVMFWSSHKSDSWKRDFLLGLAWPAVVPVMVAMSAFRWVLSAREERRAELARARAKRAAELRGREERFLSYGAAGAPEWMREEEGKVGAEEAGERFFN